MWNYRIIKHDTSKPSYFALHEVFYDDNGGINGWTAEPIDLTGESKADILRILEQMTIDSKMPVLIESELLNSCDKQPPVIQK